MVCIKPVMHIMDKPVVRAPCWRREHSAEFKRELVARSLEPGVSVAAIAMDSGINANLLFGWRRRHLESLAQAEPVSLRSPAAALLPVPIEASPREIHRDPPTPPARSGSGTIEIQIGSARVRLRGPVDDTSLRSVLTALRSLARSACRREPACGSWPGTPTWRKGFDGLAAVVQTALVANPFCGYVFVFRGRRGDILKVLRFDGQRLMLLAKRLERGRFVGPLATSGSVSLTPAQLSMLLEGIISASDATPLAAGCEAGCRCGRARGNFRRRRWCARNRRQPGRA